MKMLATIMEHQEVVDVQVSRIIEDIYSERTLKEVCEVWPGEESELLEAMEYLKEYLNG